MATLNNINFNSNSNEQTLFASHVMTTPTVSVFTSGQRVKHGQWTGEVMFVEGDQVTVRIGETDGIVNAAELTAEPPVVLQFGDRVMCHNKECGIFLRALGDRGIVAPSSSGTLCSWPLTVLKKIVCPFVVGDELISLMATQDTVSVVKYKVFSVGIDKLLATCSITSNIEEIHMSYLRNFRKVTDGGKRPAAVADDTASTAALPAQQPRLYTEQYVRDYALMYDRINHHCIEFGLDIGNDGNSISDPENVISLLRANKRGFVLEHNRIVVRARE